MAQSIEDSGNGGNLPPRARFYAVMHINGPRRRRGTIFPITAAEGMRAFLRMLSTLSSFASATQSGEAPLVCASVNRILRVSSVLPNRARACQPDFSCSASAAFFDQVGISSLIIGTAAGLSAETRLARHNETMAVNP
jgi:hypothetical protein